MLNLTLCITLLNKDITKFNQNDITIRVVRTKRTIIRSNVLIPLTHTTHSARQNQNLEANIM